MRRITIGDREIGGGVPYVIAEVGVNHEGRLDLAIELVHLAAEAGADAVKFQSYKAGKLASRNSAAYWDTTKEPTASQFELFSKYDAFGKPEYRRLAEECAARGVDFLSTPFDDEAIEFLSPLMPCFKAASADITNLPFLRRIAAHGKPVLLSCGASTLAETREALELLLEGGAPEVALLHCVLNYPTPDANANLRAITGLRKAFPEVVIGYSDHTVPDSGMTALTCAYSRGADIIEKHFTHDKTLPGNDHYHAMDASDLARFRTRLDLLRVLAGSSEKRPLDAEKPARLYARRSVVLARDVRAGEPLADAIVTKRPGTGITAANFDEVAGLAAARDLREDHILGWGDVKREGGPRTIAIVQARMGSTRFPRKALETLGDYRLIDWVLSRVGRAKSVDELVLALPDDELDNVLARIGEEQGATVVRGPEDDVLHRFVLAARASHADVIVRVCADNPFVDPAEIDRVVAYFAEKGPDYAFNHVPKQGNGYADGLGAEVFSRELLEALEVDVTDPRLREHVTLALWEEPGERRLETFAAPAHVARPEAKLDIDTEEDLERLLGVLDRAVAASEVEDPRDLPGAAFVDAWEDR